MSENYEGVSPALPRGMVEDVRGKRLCWPLETDAGLLAKISLSGQLLFAPLSSFVSTFLV